MNIGIAGAGIGGLTFAICALLRGWQVTVFEQAAAVSAVGAGIQLSPNAMRVYERLGIAHTLIDRGFSPEALEMRNGHSGKIIARLDTHAPETSPWGSRYVQIHRAELIDTLLTKAQTCSAFTLCLNSKVSAYTQHDTQVTVDTQRGIHSFDILVGADGIHSKIRELSFGQSLARFTGNVAWRFVVPTEQLTNPPPKTAAVWFGKGKHAVTYRLHGGLSCNFVGVVETPYWEEESWSLKGDKHAAQHDFKDWHPQITEFVGQAEDCYRWALMDRPVQPQWYRQRVVLLGDACHAMLPFMAQGGAMAVEDAWCLAAQLAKMNGNHRVAFKAYQDQRKPRCVAVQRLANKNAKLYHQRGGLTATLRNTQYWLGANYLSPLAIKRYDWLYGHDVTNLD